MSTTGAGADAKVVEEVARTVLATRKYRHLDPGLVRRFAREALVGRDRPADAAKHAKRKLHQAFGAFLSGPPARAVDRCVDAVVRGDDELRPACLTAMRSHASTAERVAHLDALYETVAGWCGPASSVLDLACGLNPLAIPWMDLAPGARYACCDIDRTLMGALGRLDDIVPVQVRATTCDLVAGAGDVHVGAEVDLVLLLKTATTLEQQRPGATAEVLRALAPAPVVLSLPTRSLAAGRGYDRDGPALLDRLVADTPYRPASEATFGGEQVWHLVTDSPHDHGPPTRGDRGAVVPDRDAEVPGRPGG
jgi:16S rRNA (guanine(1405)-N(7))-methyltransferase